MGEFVGINPEGARQLCGTMQNFLQQVPPLKSALASGIAEAGTDFPAGAAGTGVLDRIGTFLTDSQRDLKWRIQTITTVPGSTRVGEDFRAQFPFDSPDAARRAGAEAGDKVKSAFEAYEKDPNPTNWQAFLDALKQAQGRTGDPEFSAGFLGKIGPESYRAIFDAWMKWNKDPHGLGLTPKEVEKLKADLGPLVEAFAAADNAGLVPNFRKFIVEKGSPDFITALLAAAPHAKEFLIAVGPYLSQAVTGHTSPNPNWRLHWFVNALGQNPEAFQYLLAKDPKFAEFVLRPEVFNEQGTPGFRNMLINALDNALGEHTGHDGMRRTAFQNVAKVFSHPAVYPSVLKDPQMNEVFARHLSRYLPEIAGLQAARNDPELAKLHPGKGWDALSTQDLTNLFAGVLQVDKGAETIRAGYEKYLAGLDVGNGDIFNDDEDRAKFIRAMAQASGLGGLMVGAIHRLDLDQETKNKLYVEFAVFPIDILIGRAGKFVSNEHASTAFKNFLEDWAKWPAAAEIAKWFDGKLSPGELSENVEKLVDQQIKRFEEVRAQQGLPPLTDEDKVMLRNTMQGFYYEPMIDALKKRGG